MWGALAQVAGNAYNLWQKKEAAEQANKDYERQTFVTKQLAAQQLAITYNSILMKSLEVGAEYRREEFKLKTAARAAEGTARVQAAQTGAAGKRVELARNMAIRGGAERQMTQLQIDAKRGQDALIMRADMEERAAVNRLITNQPDIPSFDSTGAVLEFVRGGISAYGDYQDRKVERDAATTGVQLQVKPHRRDGLH